MSETSSSISSTNNTQSTNSTSRSFGDSILYEETDNMPNSITTNTPTNNNIQTENKTEEIIEQKTFDYNSETGLRDFIDFLDKNSSQISYFPISAMTFVDDRIKNTIYSQSTAKARIFDQIANYCNTQPILSKSLEKKYARMKKEIDKIKKLENKKNAEIAKLDNEYAKKKNEWVKKNRDREAVLQEDKAFNPELQKFTENYLKQKQQIETRYNKQIEIRKATYLHTHKFKNWRKYINRNENYCMAKYGQRWKNKMLNKDSKITQNGAKYSDILEYLKNFLEREKSQNKDKDKEGIIDKLVSKIKEWLGFAQKEQTNKKEVDIIKDLQNVITFYNSLVKEPEKNRLDLDTISKDIVQDKIDKSSKKFNDIKQNFNEPISQSSNKEKVNIEKDKDKNTSKIEDNISTTAQSSKSIDANKVQQKNRDNNTSKIEDSSKSIDTNKKAPNEKEKVNIINGNKLLDKKKESQLKDDLEETDELKMSLRQALNNQKEINEEKEVDMQTLLKNQAKNNNREEEVYITDDTKTVNEEFDHMEGYNDNQNKIKEEIKRDKKITNQQEMLNKIEEDIERDKKFTQTSNSKLFININKNQHKDNNKEQVKPDPSISGINNRRKPDISISEYK